KARQPGSRGTDHLRPEPARPDLPGPRPGGQARRSPTRLRAFPLPPGPVGRAVRSVAEKAGSHDGDGGFPDMSLPAPSERPGPNPRYRDVIKELKDTLGPERVSDSWLERFSHSI